MEFLAIMLPRDYGKQLSQCIHLLNLAVQADMDDFKADRDSVHSLMLKLRSRLQSTKLSFLEHLDMNDDALVEYLPPPAANRRLRALLTELKKIVSVAKALQANDVTLLDVRVWFDGLLKIKPQYERFIGPQAPIVHRTDFDVACMHILSGGSSRLKRGEWAALGPFRRLEADFVASGAADQDASSEDEASFVEKLQKRRRLVRKEINDARTTFGQERHSLQPITPEMILFLRQNSRYWNAQDVDDAIR
ncbi:hypothetical protein PHMEG_0003375 [Phytophthora megakarya]|uniref:Uncharacterized protein n=1 Tax=Phytophthora megakarya TaxID=4795 RepID=A0A225WY66_9STRA|nr:hypothetical protein PHMEG_0003375 [Phytophthora megakarya]